jgi:hypothetical protein
MCSARQKGTTMSRFRTSLLLLAAFAVLLLAGAPVSAGTADQCTAPVSAVTTATPAPTFMIIPPADYILCSCSYCRNHPDDVCRISPSGYSIVCSDWSATHC